MKASHYDGRYSALKKQMAGVIESREKASAKLGSAIDRAERAERAQIDMAREMTRLRDRLRRAESAAKSLGIVIGEE